MKSWGQPGWGRSTILLLPKSLWLAREIQGHGGNQNQAGNDNPEKEADRATTPHLA